MAKNAHFLVPLQGTLTGGDWETDYPLTNLLKTRPGLVARSVDADEANTQFVFDLGSSKPVQMFGFVNHNLSQAAEIEIIVSDNSGGSPALMTETLVIDKGQIPWGTLPWGEFPWDGIDEEFPGGFTNFYLHSAPVTGRYVLVNISDEANADGYVEIGCFLAGVPFAPAVNLLAGATVGFVDESVIELAVGAGRYSQEKPKRRRVAGQCGFLGQSEALGALYEVQAYAGRSKGALFVLNPDATGTSLRRTTLYGSFIDLGALTYREASDYPWAWSFALEELI
jgi:hypothetical protein